MQKLKHIHPIKRWKSLDVTYKVGAVLLVVILVVVGSFAWGKYQDAQNEQFLRDIVADFDSLRTQLEQELSVEVENKSGCFTTSEKFGDGKTGCFIRLSSEQNSNNIKGETISVLEYQDYIDKFTESSERYYKFSIGSEYCHLAFNQDSNFNGFAVECPVSVRSANNDLVKELF